MKRIAYIKDIQIEGLDGEPYFKLPNAGQFTQDMYSHLVTQDGKIVIGPDGEPTKRLNPPWLYRQVAFFLERIADEKYVTAAGCAPAEETPGMAQLLREDARGEIRAQREAAAKRGYWEFSDEMAARLLNVSMRPTGSLFQLQPSLAFNMAPFIRAVKDQYSPPAEEAVQAPPNGASATPAS